MLKKFAIFMAIYGCVCGVAHGAAPLLRGVAAVNVTSETAADAKTRALDSARRQILREALAPYADQTQLNAAIKGAKSSELANLIAASQIDGEQQSATTYSANITMTVDAAAASRWLAQNNVANRLDTASGNGETGLMVVTLRSRTLDWIELNRIARGENIDLDTRIINGKQMTVAMPAASLQPFARAARAAGWQASTDGDVLNLWK